MIVAQAVRLLEGGDMIARGVVAIDPAEGAPRIIFWEGEAFLLRREAVAGELCYRKTRVMYAGANFQAAR